jgi:hypothetical protein
MSKLVFVLLMVLFALFSQQTLGPTDPDPTPTPQSQQLSAQDYCCLANHDCCEGITP